jgi:hypothetical protein
MKKESTINILAEAGFDVNSDISLPQAESLTKDLKEKIITIGKVERSEIKACVSTFYQMQDMRRALTEQIRSIENSDKDTSAETSIAILRWTVKNVASIERSLEKCMELICRTDKVGRWLLATVGIGPVLAAGCLAYFDIEGKEYATQFHSYAGLNDNNRPWLSREKSTEIVNDIIGDSKVITDDHVALIAAKSQWSYEHIRNKAYNSETGKWSKTNIIKAICLKPYNGDLKSFCWKIGKSFQWNCNNSNSVYGTLFSEKRVSEIAKNENGVFADQAYEKMNVVGKTTEAYKSYSQGKLPKAHINNRALRWATKIFISHLFEEMYRVRYDKVPPRYYSLVKLDDEHNKEILPEVPYDLVSEEYKTLSKEEINTIESKRKELMGISDSKNSAEKEPKKVSTESSEVAGEIKYTCSCGKLKEAKYTPKKCPECKTRLHKIEE